MYASSFIWAKVLGYMENLLTETVVSDWFIDAELVEVTDNQLVLCSHDEFHYDVIKSRFVPYIQDAMKEIFQKKVEVIVLSDGELAALQEQQTNRRPRFIEYNPQFTFDRFVVGPSNQFAHAAAKSVAKKPADVNNPLFIHGPSGLGKTHLLYAIANEINKEHPDFNIVYIKGDEFTNELINSLQEGRKKEEFRNKYRNADLFLVDDIQFIAGKEATQEEFFHTFNSLYENHKQIVLTSDRPPNELTRLEDRLRTRFEWGLLADINPPDYETRMAIIRNKCNSLEFSIPDDVCSYIADNITNNIRQLEGTVKKIKAYHDLTGMTVDLPNVTRAIKDMYKGKADTLPTPDLIIKETARYFNITESAIRSTQRNKGVAEARQMAMYLVRSMTNLSFPDIGAHFGGRDHTTVLYSVSKVEAMVDQADNPIHETIRDIKANINGKL